MRRRRFRIVLGILVSVAASLIYAAWPGSSTFTISPETTYVTEPLDKHGYVDYVTALNERLSKGITPENNANVLIWQALGPHPEGGTMPPEYFRWLGIESPPEEGEYMVSWENFRKEPLKKDGRFENDPDGDPKDRAIKWPWTTKDEPELADWLKRNEKPLALVIEATRRPDYFNPLVAKKTENYTPGLFDSLLPSVQRCRDFASALACRAMLRVSEGKMGEAWQDLLACHRLSRLIARGGTVIEFLVGIALDQLANKADVAFLDHAKFNSKQALACLKDLQQIPSMPAFADNVNIGERFMLLDMIMLAGRHGPSFLDALAKGKSEPPKGNPFIGRLFTHSINWDPALRNANQWYDRYVTVLRITNRTERVQELRSFERDLTRLKAQVSNTGFIKKSLMGSKTRGEMIGNILIGMMLPALDKVRSAVDRCEQGQRNLHLAFTLAAYQRDNGHYPAKLDELAPKYLMKIPDDLFSGKPLIYRLEEKGYLLYSVGVNELDEDGRWYDDEPPGDDLSIRIPVPIPRVKN